MGVHLSSVTCSHSQEAWWHIAAYRRIEGRFLNDEFETCERKLLWHFIRCVSVLAWGTRGKSYINTDSWPPVKDLNPGQKSWQLLRRYACFGYSSPFSKVGKRKTSWLSWECAARDILKWFDGNAVDMFWRCLVRISERAPAIRIEGIA